MPVSIRIVAFAENFSIFLVSKVRAVKLKVGTDSIRQTIECYLWSL